MPTTGTGPTVPTVWTRSTAHAFISSLAPLARQLLAEAISERATAANNAALVRDIKESLVRAASKVQAVRFRPQAYPTGWYLTSQALLLFHDGREPVYATLSLSVHERLSQMYGEVCQSAGLVVIPSTGQVKYFSRDADEQTIADWIAAGPEQSTGGSHG